MSRCIWLAFIAWGMALRWQGKEDTEEQVEHYHCLALAMVHVNLAWGHLATVRLSLAPPTFKVFKCREPGICQRRAGLSLPVLSRYGPGPSKLPRHRIHKTKPIPISPQSPLLSKLVRVMLPTGHKPAYKKSHPIAGKKSHIVITVHGDKSITTQRTVSGLNTWKARRRPLRALSPTRIEG